MAQGGEGSYAGFDVSDFSDSCLNLFHLLLQFPVWRNNKRRSKKKKKKSGFINKQKGLFIVTKDENSNFIKEEDRYKTYDNL